MGLFDSLKRAAKNVEGAAANTSAAGAAGEESAISGLLGENGAQFSGLLDKLNAGGLDDAVKSWVGTGANQGVSAQQIKAALSSEQVKAVAAKLGVTEEVAAEKIAQILPGIVDKLTPDGLVPDPDAVADKLTGLLKNKLG